MPSMVVISLVAAALTGVTHEWRGLFPIKIVHAPHWPSPQPYLLPVRSSCSRRTVRSGVSGSASIEYLRPLTRISVIRVGVADDCFGIKAFFGARSNCEH